MNEYKKYLILKSALEGLFGKDAWYALKESNHIPTWKKYAQKTLKAIMFSIQETIEICDEQWIIEIETNIKRGHDAIKHSKDIDEIIAILAGTLINVSFWQIGFMPSCKGAKTNSQFRKGNWKLNPHRQVVYLQTKEQKEQLFIHIQRKEIGKEKQQELLDDYRMVPRNISYSDWCKNKKIS